MIEREKASACGYVCERAGVSTCLKEIFHVLSFIAVVGGAGERQQIVVGYIEYLWCVSPASFCGKGTWNFLAGLFMSGCSIALSK